MMVRRLLLLVPLLARSEVLCSTATLHQVCCGAADAAKRSWSSASEKISACPAPRTSVHEPFMPKKSSITIPDDARKHAVAALREYFDDNMDEPIGDLKAILLLDYIVSEIGPSIYNQAVADAQQYFEERTADLAGACHYSEFPTRMKRKR